jgi:hypothetical protein
VPISLRLPAELESQIAGFGARAGLSKTAVIVRSVQEYLAAHAQPTSLQIYEEAMRGAQEKGDDESVEQRPHKLRVQKELRRKHALRSARAKQASPKANAKRGGGKST